MLSYVIRRVLHGVIVLVVVTFVVFVLLHVLPGGEARAVLGAKANPVEIAKFDRQNNLDDPLPVQYFLWIGQLLHGQLGHSYNQNAPVLTLIEQRLPKTLVLAVCALALSLLIGVPLGMLQAARRNGVIDQAMSFVSVAMYAAPIFLVGIIAVSLFAVHWRIFPAQAPQGTSLLGILEDPKALVLPVVSLSFGTIAMFSRYMRSSTIENLVEDYARTARGKGASRGRVLFLHVMRNSLGPIATQLGLFLPILFGGTVIAESVFNYPGMGLLFWNAALNRDYPTEMGVALVVAAATVVGSLIADLAYSLLDPRIRYT